MVMSRTTAVGSIVVGTIELTFAIITVICGAIVATKFSGEAASSAGLWSLFYAVPGILTITAGVTKNTVVMAFALFFNIIALILSFVAAGVCIAFAVILNGLTPDNCFTVGDSCTCRTDGESDTYDMSCSDIHTIFIILITMAAVYAVLTITTFTASIYGCTGTCCAPSDPIVIVGSGMPGQGGNTVVVQSSQSAMHGYAGMAAPAAGGPPSYAQQYGDNQSLVKNMAI